MRRSIWTISARAKGELNSKPLLGLALPPVALSPFSLLAVRKKADSPAPPDAADSALFRDAVRDAIPLPKPDRIAATAPARPAVSVQSIPDQREALFESLSDEPLDQEASLETGEALTFLREGLSRQVLKKLRRGHWVVQACIDLHGMNREEAREALGEFLAAVTRRGYRCVRIIHGKGLGSKNREPVLKAKVKTWLARKEAVLAYCQAPDNQGGAGAMLVLLKS